MTHYQLLKTAETIFRTAHDNGVCVSDVRNLEVYEDLRRMEREGHKKTFIVAYLCNQYEINEATLYRIANRMARKIAF